MKISRIKFVTVFLLSGFVFQFVSNSLLGSEVRLFPDNGDFFPGMGSSTPWKSTLASIIYPVKIALIGPLAPVFKGPDPAPPVLLIAFALYWTVIALVLYFLLDKMAVRKKNKI